MAKKQFTINFQKEDKNDKLIKLLELKNDEYVHEFFTKRGFIDEITHEISQVNAYMLEKELDNTIKENTVSKSSLNKLTRTHKSIREMLDKKVNKDDVLFYETVIK